jgi:hypothetical protein
MALNLNDKTANNNHIITNNGVVESSSVPSSLSGATKSAEFDSATDELIAPHSASLNITGSLTIEFWIFIGTDSINDIGVKKFDGNSGYTVYVQGNENPILLCRYPDNTNNFAKHTNNSVLSLNTWEHWAFVFNSSTPDILIYRNGLSVTPLILINVIQTGIRGGTVNLKITGNGANIGRFCDVRVWNVARTGTEISNNYTSFLIGNEPGLVANWTFQPTLDVMESVFTKSPAQAQLMHHSRRRVIDF